MRFMTIRRMWKLPVPWNLMCEGNTNAPTLEQHFVSGEVYSIFPNRVVNSSFITATFTRQKEKDERSVTVSRHLISRIAVLIPSSRVNCRDMALDFAEIAEQYTWYDSFMISSWKYKWYVTTTLRRQRGRRAIWTPKHWNDCSCIHSMVSTLPFTCTKHFCQFSRDGQVLAGCIKLHIALYTVCMLHLCVKFCMLSSLWLSMPF